MGDTFRNVSNSVIVNRSLVNGAFQHLAEQGERDAAEAVRRLGAIVEESGDQDAAEAFDALNAEITSGSSKKGVVMSLLNGIANALPAVAKVAESVETIAKTVS